jgi:hypothetical protein
VFYGDTVSSIAADACDGVDLNNILLPANPHITNPSSLCP